MESSKIINTENLEKKIFIHQFTETKDINYLNEPNKDHLINNNKNIDKTIIKNSENSIVIEKETTNKP